MNEDDIEINADDVIDGANGDDVEIAMKLLIEPEGQLNLRRLGDKPYVLVELIVDEDDNSLTVSTVAGGRVFGLEGVRDLVGLVNNFLENGVAEEQPFVPVAE